MAESLAEIDAELRKRGGDAERLAAVEAELARRQALGPLTLGGGQGRIAAPPDILTRVVGRQGETRPGIPPGVLPTLGELALGGAGTVVAPGIGTAIGGTLGTGLGAAVEQQVARLRGEESKISPIFTEMAWSFAPEFLESALREGGRQFLRITRGGQELRLDEVARRAEQAGAQIFRAPERAAASAQFEAVGETGVRLETDNVQQWLAERPAAQVQDILTRDLRAIDTAARSGKRLETLLEEIATAPLGATSSIRDLQDLSSALLKRAQQIKDPAAQRLLMDLRLEVDTAIDTGRAVGGQTAEAVKLLAVARQSWARVRASEDMGMLLSTRPVSKLTRGGDMRVFNIDQLVNILKDNTLPLAQSVNRALDRIPGARDTFERLLAEWKQIAPERVLTVSDVGSLRRVAPVAAVDHMLAYLLTRPAGQALFRQAIVYGRQPAFDPNLLAILVNAARRVELGAAGAPGPGERAPGVLQPAGPGGLRGPALPGIR